MNNQIKAVIFDFDGLLVNTEELLMIAWSEFFRRRNKKFPDREKAVIMGRPAQENMSYLASKYRIDGDIDDLLVERRTIFKQLFDDRLELMESAEDLLKKTKMWDLKTAIASSGRREIIDEALRRLEIKNYFNIVVCVEDLVEGRGKPDPDIFILAAQRLGVRREACLVLEDAPHGVTAAKSAKMRVYGVNPDGKLRTKLTKAGANRVYASLSELDIDDIFQ